MRWGMKDGDKVQLDPDKRYLINPGSVGQPRDGDPLASCLTLDTELNEATWHRIDYPIDVVNEDAELDLVVQNILRVISDRSSLSDSLREARIKLSNYARSSLETLNTL